MYGDGDEEEAEDVADNGVRGHVRTEDGVDDDESDFADLGVAIDDDGAVPDLGVDDDDDIGAIFDVLDSLFLGHSIPSNSV